MSGLHYPGTASSAYGLASTSSYGTLRSREAKASRPLFAICLLWGQGQLAEPPLSLLPFITFKINVVLPDSEGSGIGFS